MEIDSEAPPPRDGFKNILKNLAWLLGGKGFGAVCSIIYLAILARSLGLRDFGHFSLIFGTGQAMVAIASFQTWQTIVKFGAGFVHQQDWPRFGRLASLCGRLDLLGAIIGCGIAFVIYYGFGKALHLNPAYVDMAFAFNCALVWSRMSTPNGIIRVFDRFDIGTYVDAVVPAGRLLASLIIILTGASVGKFLFAWAFVDLLSAALGWIAAWKLAPQAINAEHLKQWKQARDENPGLVQFFGITYVSSTLSALFKQGPLLAVGYFLGTSTAGLYRMADQLAQGIGKFSSLIARAVFPEFAVARVSLDSGTFRQLVRRVTIMAGAGGVMVTLFALFLGEPVLLLIGGDDFTRAAAVLLPLAIGASFDLASVSYEPLLYSTGHSTYPLVAKLVAAGVLVAAMLAFVGYGPVGAGWAVALAMAVTYLLMSAMVWMVLRSASHKDAA